MLTLYHHIVLVHAFNLAWESLRFRFRSFSINYIFVKSYSEKIWWNSMKFGWVFFFFFEIQHIHWRTFKVVLLWTFKFRECQQVRFIYLTRRIDDISLWRRAKFTVYYEINRFCFEQTSINHDGKAMIPFD